VVDKQAKKLVKSPHLPKWVDKPLGSRLEKALGVKVLLENDAALAALGEAVFGAGRRAEIVGYLTISTGIGGARVVDGRIDKKSVGFEPGHMIIDVGNKVGYWEDFASGTAMEKNLQSEAGRE
jgi:glucokinase